MATRRYTVVCEFRGGTYVEQVDATNVRDAVRVWAERLATERPIPRSSTWLAKRVSQDLVLNDPTSLDGMKGVWCITASCGGDFMLANIVETAT